jgi:hypothetical protein
MRSVTSIARVPLLCRLPRALAWRLQNVDVKLDARRAMRVEGDARAARLARLFSYLATFPKSERQQLVVVARRCISLQENLERAYARAKARA